MPDELTPGPGRWQRSSLIVVLAIGLTLVPLVVLAIRLLVDGGVAPLGDQALIALRVGDVGGRHTPLLGSYERFGGNQPGPLFFYLLAVPYRLFGADYASIQVGAVVLNAICIVGVGLVAWRRFGTLVALFTLALVGLLLNGMGSGTVANPWEPPASILLVALAAYLCTDVALGRAWSIPLLAAVSTLLAQMYLAVAPLAVVLLGAGLSLFFVVARLRVRRWPQWLDVWKPLVVSAVVLGVLWLPPIVDELRNRPGNLTHMWEYLGTEHVLLGARDAYRAISLQLGLRPPWLGYRVPLQMFQPNVDVTAAPLVPIALLALIAAAVVAVVRRDRSTVLVTVVLIALLTEWAALSRVVVPLFSWLIEPTWALGLLCWLAVGTVGLGLLPRRSRSARAAVGGVLLAGLAVVTAINTVAALDHTSTPGHTALAVHEAARRAVPFARSLHGPVLVEADLDQGGLVFGPVRPDLLALTFDRAGIPVRVARSLSNRYGRFRAAPEQAVGAVRLGPANVHPPGWTRIATVDQLTPARRAELRRLTRRLRAVGPIDTPAARLRIAAEHPRLRSAVVRYNQLTTLPRIAVLGRRFAAAP